jgi:hypothetical protein
MQDHVEEIKALIQSGDVSLDEYRGKYKTKTGQTCSLTDAQLILAIAETDDDDDDLFVFNADKQLGT